MILVQYAHEELIYTLYVEPLLFDSFAMPFDLLLLLRLSLLELQMLIALRQYQLVEERLYES